VCFFFIRIKGGYERDGRLRGFEIYVKVEVLLSKIGRPWSDGTRLELKWSWILLRSRLILG
jgi:hypothetical protein